MVIVDLNCPSNVRAAPRSSSRNLNSTFGVGRWAFLIPDLRLRFAALKRCRSTGSGPEREPKGIVKPLNGSDHGRSSSSSQLLISSLNSALDVRRWVFDVSDFVPLSSDL